MFYGWDDVRAVDGEEGSNARRLERKRRGAVTCERYWAVVRLLLDGPLTRNLSDGTIALRHIYNYDYAAHGHFNNMRR